MIQISQCNHYKRNCDKLAPCCKIYYPCRLCHDENYKGPKSGGCQVETMDRYSVSQIRCRKCQVEQPPTNECENCKIQFAHYYCDICKLYDDDKKKDIYHCEKCKMCRRGKKEELFHCDQCDVCLSLTLKDNHICQQKGFEQNCAVCQEYLKNSTKYVQQLDRCGHFIHVECLHQSLKKGLINCPICKVSIYKMQEDEIKQYDQMAEMYEKEMPEEMKTKLVIIMCMDCRTKSENVKFNVLLKCQSCGSYNTQQQ